MKDTKNTKVWIKSDNGRAYKVLEWDSGRKIEIPIDPDGMIKWFDDTKLIKQPTE